MAESCELVATISEGRYKGEPSILHQKLLNQYSRPIANYVYASYLVPGVAERMRAKGYHYGKRGEHKPEDVIEFLGVKTLLSKKTSLEGVYGKYDSAKEALDKAVEYNSNPESKLIALVLFNENEEHKGEYVVRTYIKDSMNILKARDIVYQQLMWEKSSDAFGVKALNTSLFPQKTINLEETLDTILRLKFREVQYLNEDQLDFLATQINSLLYERVNKANVGGTTVAEKLYTIINSSTVGTELKNSVIEELNKVKNEVSSTAQNIKDDSLEEANAWERSNNFKDSAVVKKILELEEAFKINTITLTKIDSKVTNLTDVYIEAITHLERKLRKLDLSNEDAINDVLDTKEMLMEELLEKQHAYGLLTFIKDGNEQFKKIIDKLHSLKENISEVETLENLTSFSEVLKEAKDFITSYKGIAEYLSVLGEAEMDLDVSLSIKDKEELKNIGNELRKAISSFELNVLEKEEETFLKNLVALYLGDAASNSLGETNVALLLSQQGSFLNRLFKSVNNSNSVIAAISVLIRDNQHKRDEELNKIVLRIAAADRKLKKAGYSSDFLIDSKTGYIKSDIDWEKYNEEKRKAIGRLYGAGYSGLELRMRIKAWEDKNCTDTVVDKVSGRTEKLPGLKYRTLTNFKEGWSDAQIEYYEEIMQLKGELGTLLPEEAQQHYLPPQLRQTNASIVDSAIKGKIGSKEARTILWDRLAHPFKIREDDREHARNGVIVNGEQYAMSFSNFDATELQKIPVFYINKLKDQNELENNFSRSLTHLASTAVNYKYMRQIQDLVEFVKDEFNGLSPIDNTKVDTVLGRAKQYGVRILHRIQKRDTNNTEVINALVERQLYGKSSEHADSTWAIALKKLTSINSVRALAVNVKGATSNILQGEYQILVEAMAGSEFFNLADWTWATTHLFGDATLGIPSALNDLATGVRTNKARLFEDIFNPQQENYRNLTERRFYNSYIRNIFGYMDDIPLYSVGEQMMARHIMYAVLHNQKVFKKEGDTFNEIPLFEAFYTKKAEDGINMSLEVYDNIYQFNGNKVDTEYIRDIKKKISKIKHDLLGAMNNEDKGTIFHNDIARAAMSFRQWMVGFLERRYRGTHIAGDMGELNETYFHNNWYAKLNDKKVPLKDIIYLKTNELGEVTVSIKEGAKTLEGDYYTMERYSFDREEALKSQKIRVGYWTDTFLLVKNMFLGITRDHLNLAAQWNNISNRQKQNAKRTLSELSIFFSMVMLFALLGVDDDEETEDLEWLGRFWVYQARRIQHDALFGIPVGTPYELLRIMKSPFPQFSTIEDMYYPISGLLEGHHTETLKNGPDKGRNKYWRNIEKEVLKIPYDIKELIRFDNQEMEVHRK